MPVSAIIRCHEDPRVVRCAETLQENSGQHEIVVVLTETSLRVADLLKDVPNVKIVWAPVGNLSKSSNIGIDASANDKVVILDANLVCSPEYLDIIDSDLDAHPLVKTKITFKVRNLIEQIAATLRNYVYQSNVFYCPGVAFTHDLKNHIGGHFFNDNVWWTEDAEMNHRIQHAGIPIYYEDRAEIIHAPESIFHDLQSAHKIGQGKYSQVVYAGRDTFEESLSKTIARLLNGKIFKSLTDLYRYSKSPSVVAYSILWNMLYYLGYYRTLLKHKLSI